MIVTLICSMAGIVVGYWIKKTLDEAKGLENCLTPHDTITVLSHVLCNTIRNEMGFSTWEKEGKSVETKVKREMDSLRITTSQLIDSYRNKR